MAKQSRKTRPTAAAPTRKQEARSRREQEQQRQILIAIGIVSAVIVVVLGLGVYQTFIGQARIPIAKVNGVDISTDEFQKEVRFRRWNLLQTFGSLSADNAQLRDYLVTQLPQQVLDNMIDTELIRQEARRRNISVTRDELDREIEQQFDYYRVPPTPTAIPPLEPGVVVTVTATPRPTATPVTEAAYKKLYTDYLGRLRDAAGYSEGDLRRDVENSLLRAKLREIVVSDVPTRTVQIHARHILTDTEEGVKAIQARLDQGEDFAAIARQESKDAATRDREGDLGWFSRGDHDSEFDQAAFTLQVGQISQPVKTAQGWEIIQVLERDENRLLTPEQLKQRQNDAFTKWLSDQQAAASIQRFFTEDKVPPFGTPQPGG
jgi:foldase protein PrsA